MGGARQTAEAARTEVSHVLAKGRRRVGGDHPDAVAGPLAVLALQRSAGNAAVNRMLARAPG